MNVTRCQHELNTGMGILCKIGIMTTFQKQYTCPHMPQRARINETLCIRIFNLKLFVFAVVSTIQLRQEVKSDVGKTVERGTQTD